MKKVVIAICAAALTLVSCNKHEVVAPQQDLTVRFSTEQLSNYAFKSALETDDKVGVFASQPISGVNVLYTATADKKLTSTDPLKWVKDNTTPVDFTAYRPYNEAATSTTLEFAAKADQSTAEAFDASDLLAANASQVVPETVVSLTFKHQLSKVAVKLTNNVEDATVTGVTIEDVVLGAKVNLVSGAISDMAEKTTVKACAVTETEYDAIIIPQTAKPMIVVALSNGLSYKFLLSAQATFAAGKVAQASLTLNPGTPSEDKVVVFSFTVLDWEAGEELTADDPVITESEPAWKVVGLGGKWNYADGVTMTKKDDVWEADITLAEGDEFKLFNGTVWAGMKANWAYYAPGDFEDGYLDGTDAGKNIVVKQDANTPVTGPLHLVFNPDTFRFIISVVDNTPTTPTNPGITPSDDDVWKVVGLGGDWSWENGVELTKDDDGVYSCTVTLAEDDTFKLNLNNGQVWAGMKAGWTYYGLGEFDDGYLDGTDAAQNIVVKVNASMTFTGSAALYFTPQTFKFVITPNPAGQ